ncbi:uncharacterized protein [Eurosta solidaginis]|uniref:uncharacterized protein n=1 Tax=Eurosta solidaginis TaxID=178769 RepID=UPI003531617B
MSRLEDLLSKKKTVVPVLDLNRNIAQTKEEFKRLVEKVPDFKVRPIKVRADEIKIKEKDYTFKTPKKEIRKLLKRYGEREPIYIYADPVPTEMKDVPIMDLCTVPIDWKMLTTLRPKSKQEEEYFSRMTEMAKLQLKTEMRDRREFMLNNWVKKTKNKSGIVETRLTVCSECEQEMCCGKSCMDINYDLFLRVEPKVSKPKPPLNNSNKGKLTGRKSFAKDGSRHKQKRSAGKATSSK